MDDLRSSRLFLLLDENCMRTALSVTCLLVLSLFAVISPAQKQPLSLTWQRTLGGTALDQGNSVLTLPNGYLISGVTFSRDNDVTPAEGEPNIWIVKLDRNGSIVWEKSYGDGRDEIAANVVPTSDGGFIVGGTTRPIFAPPTDTNFLQWWIFKIDSAGTILWEKKYGGSAPDNLVWIDIANDGSLYCVGHSSSNDRDFAENKGNYDIWILKLNDTGELIWKKNFGGSDADRATQVKALTGGGCAISGLTSSSNGDMADNHGGTDGFVAKLSANGDVEWKKTFGTTAGELFNAIQQTPDEGLIAVGLTQGADDPDGDYYLVRLDAAGSVLWERIYGGTERDEAKDVIVVGNQGFQVIGTSASTIDTIPGRRGQKDFLVYWLNSEGHHPGGAMFARMFGGSGDDEVSDLQLATPGYIAIGRTNSDDGDVSGQHGSFDVWIVKYDGTPGEGSVDDESSLVPVSIYPNPSAGTIMISSSSLIGNYQVRIENTLGEEVKNFQLRDTSEAHNIRELPAGMYVLSLYQDQQIVSRQKFVKD